MEDTLKERFEAELNKIFEPDLEQLSGIDLRIAISLSGSVETHLQAMQAAYNLALSERWVDVKDRLPEIGQFVLVYRIDGHILVDQLRHFHGSVDFLYKVTHWCELPQPPSNKRLKEI